MATYNGLNDAARYALSAADTCEFGRRASGNFYHRYHTAGGYHKVVDQRTVKVLKEKGLVEVTSWGALQITGKGLEAYREANRLRIANEGI